MSDTWSPNFLSISPAFAALTAASAYTDFSAWPTLQEMNVIAEQFDCPVRFVSQATAVDSFEEGYEPRVFLQREVQTRLQNWHDFFNHLVWLTFPQIKLAINRQHYDAQLQRYKSQSKQRTRLENQLTHFDECGLIVVCNDGHLVDLLTQHQWYELFYQQRDVCLRAMKFYIFGHAIYEKLLEPYLGLCAKAVILDSEQAIEETVLLDKDISLHPVPILGFPGWYNNQSADFYLSNSQYFR